MALTAHQTLAPLKHGGDISSAIATYGPHPDGWLDMSTGISPWAWPVPNIDPDLWHSLPPSCDTLIQAAADYYQTPADRLVATPGSQLAIRLIPKLFSKSCVAVPSIGYQEHARSWALAGHNVQHYKNQDHLLDLLDARSAEHAVVINPNNPTGEIVTCSLLSTLANKANGHVIVDEAFADCVRQPSASRLQIDNLVVLKSMGKFFGLAGLRVGFVDSNSNIINTLKEIIEPWSISGPSMYIAEKALSDTHWQAQQKSRIRQQSSQFTKNLSRVTEPFGITKTTHSGLFHTAFGDKTAIDGLHDELAKVGIWSRRYNHDDSVCWLRLSLPADCQEFERRVSNIQTQKHRP